MKNKRRIYNINTFSFYRRHVKPIDLDKAFIKLIETEEKKINEKKILLKRIIQIHKNISIVLIMTI